jgi:hypothetical protein
MKKCSAGHYYSDHLDACPYCSPESNNEVNETLGSTAGFMDETNEAIPTELLNEETKTIPFSSNSDQSNQFNEVPNTIEQRFEDFDKTVIIDSDDSQGDSQPAQRLKRKLAGWLVSYTLDELGLDFRLYEGKNCIGSKIECEVPVLQDKSVSGKHATILFRNNKFLLKDEFSTNGTYLNDNIVEEETPVLKDGDVIKVGNTIFKFKVAL